MKAMPDEPHPSPGSADQPTNTLAGLQAKQSALIKQGKELMRQLDEVTAEISRHQARRDDSTTRWNKH